MKLFVITSKDGYPLWVDFFYKPAKRFVDRNPDCYSLLVFKKEKGSLVFSRFA